MVSEKKGEKESVSEKVESGQRKREKRGEEK
jgi:hypothetical protein